MDIAKKRNLMGITYFTCIAFMIVIALIFGIFLGTRTNVVWAQIAYYIWLGIIVLNTAFDIICTFRSSGKYITGLILFILTIITLCASIALYFAYATNGVLLVTSLYGYISSVFLSYFINILAIIIFCTGEKLVNYVNK